MYLKKTQKKTHSRKKKGGCGCGWKGGYTNADLNLAYPETNIPGKNPALAFTGLGGKRNKTKLQRKRYIMGGNHLPPSFYINTNMQSGGAIDVGGGEHYIQGAPFASGLVGSPWGGKVSEWPGVNGISGDRNYLAPNLYKNDPQTENVVSERVLKGGKTHKKKTKKGGSLPSQIKYQLHSLYNVLDASPLPSNPLPFYDQFKKM